MAKIISILAAALMISTSTVHAEPLEMNKTDYCKQYDKPGTWHWDFDTQRIGKGLSCIWAVAGSKMAAKNAAHYRALAETSTYPDVKQKYLNKAAYEQAEAERYAAKYFRDYAPK